MDKKIGKISCWHLAWLLPLLVLLLWLGLLSLNLLTNNFHAVIDGKIYRSSQLPAVVLQKVLDDYGIRSVVNLRGPYPKAQWYQDELAITRHRAVAHYDAHLPAHGIPTWQQLNSVLTILKNAPRPILIHCRQGADRTGLMSAMAVILSGSASRHQAVQQASWLYNVLSPASVGYQVLRNYFAWLDQSQNRYGKTSFVQWVNQESRLIPYQGIFLF